MEKQMKTDIEFISYNGAYPCLCCGTLVIKVNGKEYTFDEDSFWVSGGSCYYSNEEEEVTTAPWIVLESELPEELKPYASEIEEVINENILYGCCGGCL